VTYEIDENSILNVTAVEKSKGTQEKITITQPKGRFSKDQIDEMVSKAQKSEAEDEKILERIQAKNGLESLAYNIKNQLNDEKIKAAISEADRKTLEDKVAEAIKWLEGHQNADSEEFKNKTKELEGVFHPIIQKLQVVSHQADSQMVSQALVAQVHQLAVLAHRLMRLTEVVWQLFSHPLLHKMKIKQ
jgi:L1 cell adhesion molecule like protein